MNTEAPLAPMLGAPATRQPGIVPLETQVVRVGLATEAVVLGVAGLMAAVLALMTAASGRQWLMYVAAVAGVSLSMLALAGLLVLLYRRLSSALDRWKVGVLALEVMMMPVGWWAMSLEAA